MDQSSPAPPDPARPDPAQPSPAQVLYCTEKMALEHMQSVLQQNGPSCSDFGLPNVETIINANDFDLHQEHQLAMENIAILNEDQRAVLETVIKAIETDGQVLSVMS